MFQINAVLNKAFIDDVLQGLAEENIQGVTILNVMGKGCQSDKESSMTEKTMLTVVVADTIQKDVAMEAIRANAQDTEEGAGKMWVTPVLEVERIRTGEKNEEALTRATEIHANHAIDNEVYNPVDTPAS